jgi:hypothetical protein
MRFKLLNENEMKITRHKFGAIASERDGKKFPSKLEARYYDQLKLRQSAGEVLFFLRQCPIDLPGGVTYRVDFVEFLSDGTVDFVDCKGMETPVSSIKIKQVEDLYPFSIKIVKKL